MSDTFNLARFLEAQGHCYDRALAELKAGSKTTHWMWFIFPQFDGLGNSSRTKLYAIKSREEAEEYWQHPVLGERLRECFGALLPHRGRTALEIMGSPDDMKLRSSATLFYLVTQAPLCKQVLDRFYGGKLDERTVDLLG